MVMVCNHFRYLFLEWWWCCLSLFQVEKRDFQWELGHYLFIFVYSFLCPGNADSLGIFRLCFFFNSHSNHPDINQNTFSFQYLQRVLVWCLCRPGQHSIGLKQVRLDGCLSSHLFSFLYAHIYPRDSYQHAWCWIAHRRLHVCWLLCIPTRYFRCELFPSSRPCVFSFWLFPFYLPSIFFDFWFDFSLPFTTVLFRESRPFVEFHVTSNKRPFLFRVTFSSYSKQFLFSSRSLSRDRRGVPASSNNRSGHAYGHVYGGAYEDDYSISQHQARTGNGSANRAVAVTTAGAGGVGSTAVVAPSERNGKSPGRFQDPAPRAWGDGSVPRYVASPTHATSPSVTSPTGTPSAPAVADYERPPPYYYPGPAWVTLTKVERAEKTRTLEKRKHWTLSSFLKLMMDSKWFSFDFSDKWSSDDLVYDSINVYLASIRIVFVFLRLDDWGETEVLIVFSSSPRSLFCFSFFLLSSRLLSRLLHNILLYYIIRYYSCCCCCCCWAPARARARVRVRLVNVCVCNPSRSDRVCVRARVSEHVCTLLMSFRVAVSSLVPISSNVPTLHKDALPYPIYVIFFLSWQFVSLNVWWHVHLLPNFI